MSTDVKKKKVKKERTSFSKAVIAYSILFAILIGGFAYLGVKYNPNNRVLTITDDNSVNWKGEQELERSGSADTNKIRISCFQELTFKKDSNVQKVNIYNDSKNKCYMKFSIIINDRVIWQSDYVEPDKGFYEIELEKPLEKGCYEARCKVDCQSFDGKHLNGANFKFTLYVK